MSDLGRILGVAAATVMAAASVMSLGDAPRSAVLCCASVALLLMAAADGTAP